ncbi:hypothetical protein GCM10010255_34720 [Streptomyces coeruleofuscus]|uniref:Uncharacterized protein n=1 Tax=Streptomyces coeruleofuscus TaxID=66879 RepID=A0ABP5VC13_9ACTN
MLVVSVPDGAGTTEAVLLEETYGTGVTAEGIGVQGPVRLPLQEDFQNGTGVPGDTTIQNGFKSFGGQFGTHPVDGLGPGGGARVPDDRVRPGPHR